MSARLIGELANWLTSPAAEDVTPPERLVLFVVAERSHERSRLMLRHRGDAEQLVDRIARTTGLARDGALKKAFQRLAARGLDVRIPVAQGKGGRPVFAYEGRSMRFRLPEFPASVAIPERPAPPVDNSQSPVDNPPPSNGERRDESSRLSPRGETNRPASEAERRDESSRPTPYNYISDPSEELLCPSHSTSSVAEVAETLRARPREPTNTKIRFGYQDAIAYLLTVPGDIQAAATAAAEHQLGPGAATEALRIRAAEIAAKGVPA